jgi:hypothetical protein
MNEEQPKQAEETNEGVESSGGDQDAESPAGDDSLIREEEEAAGSEAADIGGRSGMEGMKEAERSSAEHGGGVAEGFEEAEALLEDQAAHGDPLVNPSRDASGPEPEEDPAVHGEADHIDSTEKDDDDS